MMLRALFAAMVLVFVLMAVACGKEGTFLYRGVVVDRATKKTLDSVYCRIYVDGRADVEQITDTTGKFSISWGGFINKHSCNASFTRVHYRGYKFRCDSLSKIPNDTVFLELDNR